MQRRVIGAALFAGVMAGTAEAAPNFADHWSEAPSKTRCFAVRGFLLKPDGVARMDWAAMNRVPPVDGHYDGRWTSEGGLLHLSMTLHISISDPTANWKDVSSMEIRLDGPVDSSGDRLDLTITTDGEPRNIRCAYVRDK